MRILFIDHGPLTVDGVESHAAVLARGLLAAGHDAHVLTVDVAREARADFPARQVLCRRDDPRADLPFDAPCFTPSGYSRQLFAELSDAELAAYRETIRQALDDEIAGFNPRVIHCQHIWVAAHLALETGVPYVITAYADELAAVRVDPRYRRLVQEASENAGRILVTSDAIRGGLPATCGDVDNRVVVVGESIDLRQLVAIYQQVIDERMG